MERKQFLAKIHNAVDHNPVTALLGPRQCGKTTLARDYVASLKPEFPEHANYFDLEDPQDLARLADPILALSPLSGVIVIDEIQRFPNLFPILRVLVDKKNSNRRFLILGSASRELINQSSESLAGRITHLEITQFQATEVGIEHFDRLWIRGGFPRSYLADNDAVSMAWRNDFTRTFLERDIPQLGIQIPAADLRRFWMMLAHYHGQIFNASELGRSLGIADTTARRYLEILRGAFMIRVLTPWIENLKKRQIKSPKIYFRDTGILHHLLGVESHDQLLTHPKLGASWEGFAFEEIVRFLGGEVENIYFWGVHQQAELDLLYLKGSKRIGWEIKYSSTPTLTKSISQAIENLKLDKLYIVFPGEKSFSLDSRVTAVGLTALLCGTRDEYL